MEKEQKILIARLILTALLFALSFFNFLGELGKLIISLVGFLIIGYDVIFKALKNIIHGKIFDERFLMLIASIGAFAIKEFHEALAVMLFYQLGEFLQDLAVDKSKDSIKKLMDIRPDYANLIFNEEIKKVHPSEVLIGAQIVVYAGEKIPLDGVIVSGTTTLDTAVLTGESLPKDSKVGDTVLSGMINLSGTIYVKVLKSFSESSVSKIIELVENAENKKAKSENFITKFARIYTPIVVCLAILLCIIPPLCFGLAWNDWIHRALLFLVVSCPCALVISIPLSFFVGIGGASKKGILIKGANHIETLADVGVIGFDKTGTLTKGNFAVVKVKAIGCKEKELVKLCALAEIGQSHPIAESIVKYASGVMKIDEKQVLEQTSLAGLGIKAIINNKTIFVGNQKLMEKAGAEIVLNEDPGTTIFVSEGSKFLGYIVISDEIRESSKIAISKLKALGIKQTIMLTGDKDLVAENVASQVGIDKYFAELLPQDKAKIIEEIKATEKQKIAFVGDGINDAPVLKTADIGISMGKLGSDIAIESADIALMDDNVEKIADAIKLSRKTMKVVKENLIFTIGFKLVMLVLGALGIAPMWLAIFADVGVSLLAILNSLRALKF